MFSPSDRQRGRQVVLIFGDGSMAAWDVTDVHARPFLTLARSLIGEGRPLNPTPRTAEGHIERSDVDRTV